MADGEVVARGRTGGGAWRVLAAPGERVGGETWGGMVEFGSGHGAWPSRWRQRRTAPPLRHEGERTEEEERERSQWQNCN